MYLALVACSFTQEYRVLPLFIVSYLLILIFVLCIIRNNRTVSYRKPRKRKCVCPC